MSDRFVSPLLRNGIELGATVLYATILTVILLSPLRQEPHPRGQYLKEKTTVGDFVVNVAVFAPLGFGLGRCGRRSSLNQLGLIVVVAVLTCVFSLAVESMQYLWLPGRFSSIVDVAGNTVGAALGAGWATRRSTSAPRSAQRRHKAR